jgi:catechol 2,3-dioxygenase-like lactoylglutathione lyase family enzyme
MKLAYAIKFVADMDRAVRFHRDTLGLPLAFESPFWSEFATGDTKLALHLADADHPAGATRLGYATDDLGDLYARRDELGLTFIEAPREQHGTRIASFRDNEDAECSMSG